MDACTDVWILAPLEQLWMKRHATFWLHGWAYTWIKNVLSQLIAIGVYRTVTVLYLLRLCCPDHHLQTCCWAVAVWPLCIWNTLVVYFVIILIWLSAKIPKENDVVWLKIDLLGKVIASCFQSSLIYIRTVHQHGICIRSFKLIKDCWLCKNCNEVTIFVLFFCMKKLNLEIRKVWTFLIHEYRSHYHCVPF